jgi:predicted amidohydrolase
LGQSTLQYDIVLEGGRVIDPETKLDAIRNVGIQNGRIMMISSDPLVGKETVNVSGMVVAPGFIDLHVHGVSMWNSNTNCTMGSRRLWNLNGE